MNSSKLSFLAILSGTVIISGCSSARLDEPTAQMPSVYKAAPVAKVQQSDLPPPAPVVEDADAGANKQVASLEPPENALELTPASVAGVWRASIGGTSCQIATPQTKFGQGYRAGPMRCPGLFSDVKSWAISGKKLSFFDSAGNPIAALYSEATGGFSGQTTSGQTVVLSR